MEEIRYTIRAHHGMCLAFFEGKGYSPEFVENMKVLQTTFSENPMVRVVCHTDRICGACPNNQGGKCKDAEKVARYDRQVMERCGLEEGVGLPFAEFERLVEERILQRGGREEICGDCQWNAICKKRD